MIAALALSRDSWTSESQPKSSSRRLLPFSASLPCGGRPGLSGPSGWGVGTTQTVIQGKCASWVIQDTTPQQLYAD